ncbi:MAG: L-threonylcarbamoyladenylate synthase [Gammaproteobacteria bacterium]|nr:L-threonylcarbamoyladenylate synthase [Gammaproteobacteria bacterium]
MTRAADIADAVQVLRSGGVVAFPTETVYGLGADASNPAAVERVFAIKGRPAHHPLIIHIADAAQLRRWARDIPQDAHTLTSCFSPGPLTLILKRAPQVPDCVTGGQDTVGLRVPSHPVALELLHAFGGGIAAPSANRFGHVSPTTAAHVHAELGGEVDMILDGGPCRVGLESTIVSLVGDQPVILRPGAISRAMLEQALAKNIRVDAVPHEMPRAPGMLEAHYAPSMPLFVVPVQMLAETARTCAASGQRVGIICIEPGINSLPEAQAQQFVMPHDAEAYGQRLYAVLHEADAAGLQVLLVEQVPGDEAWLAVRDRLSRAAAAHG